MVEWLLLLLASLLSLCYLKFWWSHRRILSTASQLPCPPTYPLIGNLHYFTGGLDRITENIYKFAIEFKEIFCFWAGPLPIFVATDPTIVRTILNSSGSLDKDDVYQVLKPFLGNGLINAPGYVWKKSHRLVSPVLHLNNVQLFLPEFNEFSRRLCEDLECAGTLDPKDKLFDTFTDAVMCTALGLGVLNETIRQKVRYIVISVGEFIVLRFFKFGLQIEFIFNLVYRHELKLTYQYLNDCVQYFHKIWRVERDDPKNKPHVKSLEGEVGEGHFQYPESSRKTLRGVADENPFLHIEDYKLDDDIFTTFVSATDSTLNTARFFLVTLANYPEVQAKIRAEIKEVMNDSDRDVTPSDLQAMTYLNCALLESIRLHGAIPFIGRRITKDIQIKINNLSSECTLPAGSRIFIHIHAMGMNPDRFPEPNRFIPERFFDTIETNHNFIPFSVGKRRCPGESYAKVIIKTLVVHLLRNFYLTTKVNLEDIKYEMKIVMESKSPINIHFKPIRAEL